MKASLMTIALALGLVASSCSQSEDTKPELGVGQQGEAELSLEIGIDQVEERQRALNLTSSTGTPLLSQMAVGTEVPVHLFFSNGTEVSYVQKNFKVTEHKTLVLKGAKATLNGFTSKTDARNWYVCGYIGGTPENSTVNNRKLNFSGGSLQKVSVGGEYSIAYPYAFAWKQFKWSETLATEESRKPFNGLVFKPQGMLLRLRLTYSPTAAPYKYKVTHLGITSSDLTTSPTVVVPTGSITGGSLPAWQQSTAALSLDNDIEDVTMSPNRGNPESYWLWAVQTKAATEAKFKVSVTGEAEYPQTGNVVRSLLKKTETADITVPTQMLEGSSPAYNIAFNPERPLLPIDFMAYGDANGNKSEAADGFVRGSSYFPNRDVYNSLSTLMKENRYLPTILDMSSVQWSSVPDEANPFPEDAGRWYTWKNASYDYSDPAQSWHLTSRSYEAIEILQGYTGNDATIKKLQYSNHTLKALYYHQNATNVVYGLRMIGDGNKRLSAWRYERVSGSGIKIEAVYLGPKWEHASKGNQALQYVSNESFWTSKRTDKEVITRYLNQKPTGAANNWVSVSRFKELDRASLGRYIVATKADNRGVVYNYLEFDNTKVWKAQQQSTLPERTTYANWNNGFVRFFKINPYLD